MMFFKLYLSVCVMLPTEFDSFWQALKQATDFFFIVKL